MPIYHRKDDEQAGPGWLSNISRFELKDLAILVALIFWLVFPRPDSEARASVLVLQANIAKIDTTKQNKEASDLQYIALNQKLESVSDQIRAVDAKIERMQK